MTLIPCYLTSYLRALEKPSMANFEAQYKVRTGTPINPDMDRMFTKCPYFLATILLINAFVIAMCDMQFVSIMYWLVSNSRFTNSSRMLMPPLLMTISTLYEPTSLLIVSKHSSGLLKSIWHICISTFLSHNSLTLTISLMLRDANISFDTPILDI